MRRDERIAEMMKMARELAGRGHRPEMIETMLAANGFREARSSSISRISSASFEISLIGHGGVKRPNERTETATSRGGTNRANAEHAGVSPRSPEINKRPATPAGGANPAGEY